MDKSQGPPANTKGDRMRPDPATEVDELAVVVECDGAPPRANPAATYRLRMDQGGVTGGGSVH
jgi:hypothetical protein